MSDFGSCRTLVASIRFALLLSCINLSSRLSAESPANLQAPVLYDQAVLLRTALEGKPKRLRTGTEYQKVINKYRTVYYQFPTSSKADDALLAVAELYQLMGSDLKSPRSFQQAIQAYAFLEREYPASPYGAEGLFTAAEIYLNDLNDAASAQEAFTDLLKRYPHSKKARNARARLDDLRAQLKPAKKSVPKPLPVASKQGTVDVKVLDTGAEPPSEEHAKAGAGSQPAKRFESAKAGKKAPAVEAASRKPSVISTIRYWNTEEYTRLVIDTESEVKYVDGRVDNPSRVFIDIQNVRLSSALAGKTLVLNDGYVDKIRFGQPNETVARVVLDIGSIKSCQVLSLSDPPRIVIDVQGIARGAQPKAQQASDSGWKVRYGEPLVDELTLFAPPQKGASGSAREATGEKQIATRLAEPSAQSEPVQSKRDKIKKPAAPPPAKGDSRNTAAAGVAAASYKEAKMTARASLPKSDGTRSLIRTLGLKVGRIVIDPGHGGHDTGTIGPSGLQEKDLVLDIALKLKKLVEERLESEVLLTRTDDTFVPLEERTAMANQSQADLFLSIHANSSRNRRVSGVETFFLDFASSSDAEEIAARENSSAQKTIFELQDLVQKIALKEKVEESRELAQIVQKAVASQLQKAHSQTRDRGVKQAPFIVLIGANMPSILSEVSFMSNPSDEKLLKSSNYRQKVAEALCRGIEAYAEALGGIKTARNLP